MTTARYEQLAFNIVKSHADGFRAILALGLTPAPLDVDKGIADALTDNECDTWTQHKERKLRKYIDLRVRITKVR